MSDDLFSAPVPPDNPCDRKSHRGCCYDALASLACYRWAWKRQVEQLSDGLLRGRTNGDRNPEQESAGRNIPHVRKLLADAGTGWTVLDEAGRVCLCWKMDVAVQEAKLKELQDGQD